MAIYWRISQFADLSGEGGRISRGRWHTQGRPVVYLAENPASAMLERIVHMQEGSGELPLNYTLLKISAPDGIAIRDLLLLAPADWKENLELTRRLGDEWLASQDTAIARAPSVILPQTWNILFNPAHPDAGNICIAEIIRERFDNRLFRFGSR